MNHDVAKPPSKPPVKRHGPWLVVVVLLVGSTFGIVISWQYWRHDLARSEVYRLDPAKIAVPDPPPWVPDNFVEEALQSAGWDHEGSILDRRMPERLASILLAHPWVAEVQEVRLVYPGGADVSLTYREPVALVELADGWLPVDRHGVLLRTDYFLSVAPEEVDRYLRIRGTIPAPLGSVGTPWGHAGVAVAAHIAWLLHDLPPEAGLRAVRLGDDIPASIRLQTRNGAEIVWGEIRPSLKTAPEDQAKAEKLRQYIELYGSLDHIPPAQLSGIFNEL